MFNVLFVAILCAAVATLVRWARTKTATGRRATLAYTAIVERSREPFFYATMAVPDTMEGRFGVLILHLFAAVERLSHAGTGGGAVARATVEAFVTDIEDNMREAGIGDTIVPKNVKRAAIAFYDRRAEYRAALLAGDAKALAATIAGHVAGDANASCGLPLARYLATSMAHLEAIDDARAIAGDLTFPSLDDTPTVSAARSRPMDAAPKLM